MQLTGRFGVQLFRVEMLKRFNSVFDAWIYFDMDGDGSITLKEFEATCRPLKLTEVSPSGVVEVFNQIDAKDKLFKLWPFTFARYILCRFLVMLKCIHILGHATR
jgi:hypothetical protein